MDITFKSSKLAKIFNSEKALIKEYGLNSAKKIKLRMAMLKNAPTLAHVPKIKPDRCHELVGNRKGHFAVDLDHPFRLIFIPDHEEVTKNDDGSFDLCKIISIKILSVEDYHD